MKYTTGVFSIYKIVAAGLSCIWMIQKGLTAERIIEVSLVVFCLIAFDYFINQKHTDGQEWMKSVILVSRLLSVGVMLAIGWEALAGVWVITVIQCMSGFINDEKGFTGIEIACSIIGFGLLAVIGNRKLLHVTVEGMLLVSMFYTLVLRQKLHAAQEKQMEQRKEVVKLQEQLRHNKALTKTIQYSARLEERNRLSVRLHDKIGHNISGSIMILEAAMLQYEKNPDRAIASVQMATQNLKQGIDDIRAALREERPVLKEIGKNDLQLLLGDMETKHGFHTFFRTEGDLEDITVQQWKCIYDNAQELMTNTIKHSKGTMFTIEIHVMSSMIKVQYYDNGGCKSFVKGMGLQAIEERSIKCGGNCFFEGNETGFYTNLIFMKQSSQNSGKA